MEPESVSCIYVNRVARNNERLTVRKLNCAAVSFAAIALYNVVCNDKVSLRTLEVDTTCVTVECVSVKRDCTACTL